MACFSDEIKEIIERNYSVDEIREIVEHKYSYDEIKEIVEAFPSSSQHHQSHPLQVIRTHENNGIGFDECLRINDTIAPFKTKDILLLSLAGYLTTSVRLTFKPTGKKIMDDWEKDMRNSRMVEVKSGKKVFWHVFDSEKELPPKGVTPAKWKCSMQKARIQFREYLLLSGAITENDYVCLSLRPDLPSNRLKEERYTGFFPIQKWRLKDRYLKPASEHHDYNIYSEDWKCGRSENCGKMLVEKKKKETPPIVILKEEVSGQTASPRTRKSKYPLLTDKKTRQIILRFCKSLPKSLHTNPKQWITAKELSDRTGRSTDSLRSMRNGRDAEKYDATGDKAEPRLNGVLIRDSSGRIAFKQSKETQVVHYWVETIKPPITFWDEKFPDKEKAH